MAPCNYEPGEYIGITWYRHSEAERDEVWTSFSGTLPADDPYSDEVVIWSSLIEW